ncbi:queuine tRNA-ribosyltransferase accessory subunit 2-like [Actinia tenebrosa]|uniref:Queuine tRNA-ribosyltransferase accessory subunit 2 n=1 Tax=Actinia tenebrosa TaxID=6105 RepID=A0A6P8I9M5_ACTTE|nr:queuine tRNA-ribosyltransferase accessory subunit 2-like [Actinia tenebrosa]
MELKLNYQREGCRSGELQFDRIPLETPMFLLYTRSGAIPHVAIWNDLLEHNYFTPIQLTLPTLVDQPSIELVKGLDKGIHSFIGQKTLSVLTVQDPAADLPSGYNEDKSVSVWNAGGRRKVDVAQFSSTLLSFRPNVVECLCDTIPSKGQTPKRIKKSVDRTLKYLDEIVTFKEENKALENCSLLGAIEGSDSISERIRSAKETASRQVEGFVLEGFDGSADDWTNLLTRTVSELPENKPRFIQGIKTPDDIIKAVECGIDVFDSSFPYQVSERGCALIFPSPNKKFKPESSHIESVMATTAPETESKENKDKNNDNEEGNKKNLPSSTKYEIDLHDTRFKSDMSSIDSCGCYCCTSHSRAYVHHLLVTKEMLAQVLLMMHNMHQYSKFFEQMRQALNDGKWNEFKSRF